MKNPFLLLSLFFCLFLLHEATYSQNRAFLAVKNTANASNYKYFTGDQIIVRLKNDTLLRKGTITCFYDSSFLINDQTEVQVDRIIMIIRPRFWNHFLSKGLKIFGITYFGLTGLNRSLNHEYPVYEKSTVLTSLVIYSSGILLKALGYKKLKLPVQWRAEVLNFKQFEDQ